jgi:hypothetical protein
MIENSDQSIAGADPMRFFEFIDADGFVCFQKQLTFSYVVDPRAPTVRVSPEVWFGIHNVSKPEMDRAPTPDELLVELVTLQVDQRIRRGRTHTFRNQQVPEADFYLRLSNLLKHQIWDWQLEQMVLGRETERRDRQIKTGSLFLKSEAHRLQQIRSMRRPLGVRVGRFLIPFDEC